MGIISPQPDTPRSKILTVLFLAILLPFVLGYIFLYLIWGCLLCFAIWLTWNGKSILFVYSNSPIWKDYIEAEIIPRIQPRAVILNWSERNTWRAPLSVLAFRYFGKDRDFNPLAVVFRPFHIPKTYRFLQAFKKFKHGDTKHVELLKEELFSAIRI